MASLQVEIKDYADRPGIFAVRLPDGRWQDFDRATLAAEWVWHRHLTKCDSHVAEALQVRIQNAVDLLNEVDGVIPFTEALGKGEVGEYETEIEYLAREMQRIALEATAPVVAAEAGAGLRDSDLQALAQVLEDWVGCEPDGLDDDSAAFIGELGTAGLSVLPTAYILDLQARAHPAAAPAAAGVAEGGWLAAGEPAIEYRLQYQSIGGAAWYDLPGSAFTTLEAAVRDMENTLALPDIEGLFEVRVMRATTIKETPAPSC